MEKKQLLETYWKHFISKSYSIRKQKMLYMKQLQDSQMAIQLSCLQIMQCCRNLTQCTEALNQMFLLQDNLEKRTVGRKIWKMDRESNFWEMEVPNYSEEKFKQDFRISRKSFHKLCSELQCLKKIDTNKRKAISLEKRVAISLYSLGSTCGYRTVGNLFGVGRTTVGRIVSDFCSAVCSKMKEEYLNTYPPSVSKVKEIVAGFEELGFPQCFGAIDGCYIELSPHKDEDEDLFNSIVLFASADYRCRFTYINVGAPGRNTSYVFENSSLKKCHETNPIFYDYNKIINGVTVPALLIGDSSFRLSKYVMTPYPDKVLQSRDEMIFNYKLAKCRRVIENTFGQLKARFRKIGKGLEVRPENAPIIIKACCVLHNFLNEESDDICDSWMKEYEEAEESKTNRRPQYTARMDAKDVDCKSIRRAIKFSLCRDSNGDCLPLSGVDVPGDSGIRNKAYVSGGSVVISNAADDAGKCEDISGKHVEI